MQFQSKLIFRLVCDLYCKFCNLIISNSQSQPCPYHPNPAHTITHCYIRLTVVRHYFFPTFSCMYDSLYVSLKPPSLKLVKMYRTTNEHINKLISDAKSTVSKTFSSGTANPNSSRQQYISSSLNKILSDFNSDHATEAKRR